jgi:ribosomal protein S15P/S13E
MLLSVLCLKIINNFKSSMVKLELAHKDVILCILDYLHEHGMVSSYLALEQEADTSLFKYS